MLKICSIPFFLEPIDLNSYIFESFSMIISNFRRKNLKYGIFFTKGVDTNWAKFSDFLKNKVIQSIARLVHFQRWLILTFPVAVVSSPAQMIKLYLFLPVGQSVTVSSKENIVQLATLASPYSYDHMKKRNISNVFFLTKNSSSDICSIFEHIFVLV